MGSRLNALAVSPGGPSRRQPRILAGIVTAANDDGSYDVALPDAGAILPGLYRSVGELARLAPGDTVAVEQHGPAIRLL